MNLQLLAGVARSIISPPKGIFLIGYGDRTKGNIGIHDDLYATALVLDDGMVQLAIVALDMLTINEFIVDRVRACLAPTECLLCCSHTHSGPIAYADKKSPRKNRDYIDSLVENIVTAVQDAQADLMPVRLEYSLGEGSVGINRREEMPDGHFEIGRNPDGPRDKSVQVVSVLTTAGRRKGDKEGTRLATIVNYACHGTVLGPDNLLVSADWIGVMRDKVEAELGGLTLFLQGAAANINPDMYWEDAHAFEKVTEQGSSVAEAVLAAAGSRPKKMRGVPLRIGRAEMWMPTEARVTTSHPPKNYAKPLLALAKLPGFLAIFADPLLKQRYPWRPVIEAKDGFWSVPMRINAVRIGDLVLVTFGAETFTEIGMKVKAGSPASHTLFASVSDGCISYLHTEESHTQGGYEVDVAPLAYRYPGRLQAGCEQIALNTASSMLKRLMDVGTVK
jgi:neutral ceramidase